MNAEQLVPSECARCGRPVFASDPRNLEMEVCGSCGLDIGASTPLPGTPDEIEAAWVEWKAGCVTRPPKQSFFAGWRAAREVQS